MDIILIRHGESMANLSRTYGDSKSRLSKLGRDQALRSSSYIKGMKFSKVYTSPMVRAIETTNYLGLEGIVDTRLREVGFGLLEGRTFDDFQKDYREETKRWMEDPFNNSLPGGESIKEAYSRFTDFIEDLVGEGEDSILVTHDGIIRCALAYALDNLDLYPKFMTDNLGVSMVRLVEGYKFINFHNRIYW